MTGKGPNDDGTGAPAPRGIEALFLALESQVLGYALRLVGDREVAEDIVQEAFMKLHVHFDQVREPRRWVYRTVHNLALNHRRTRVRLVPIESSGTPSEASDADLVDPLPLPDEQIARWEGIGLVRLTLEAMEPRSREVVRLKFHENLSYQQISDATGLSQGHVGYILHHALKSLGAELGKIGVTS